MLRNQNRLFLLLVSSACILAGCSSQDFGRPAGSLTNIMDSGQPYATEETDAQEEAEATRRAERLTQLLQTWETKAGLDLQDYAVGPEDVLTVGILALDKPGELTTLARSVSKDQSISLPLIGDIQVGGQTARQIQERITEKYDGQYLRNPQVTVVVKEYLSSPIVVTGAVAEPGMYYLRHNHSSVLEILSLAGGLTDEAGVSLLIVRPGQADVTPGDAMGAPGAERDGPLEQPADTETTNHPQATPGEAPEQSVEVKTATVATEAQPADSPPVPSRRSPWARLFHRDHAPVNPDSPDTKADGVTPEGLPSPGTNQPAPPPSWQGENIIEIDLEKLLTDGESRMNCPIFGGDIITVPPRKHEFVYVLGYVNRPGAIEVPQTGTLNAMHAVAMAGGLSTTARAQNSFLISQDKDNRRVTPVDLTKIARGSRPPLYMEAGDTLVIGSGVLVKLAEFIKVGANASVSPLP